MTTAARSIEVSTSADDLTGGGGRTRARGVPRGMETTRNGNRGAELEGRQFGWITERQGRCGKRYATAEHTLVLEVIGGLAWHRSTIARDYAIRSAERRLKSGASHRERREPVQSDCQDEKPDGAPVRFDLHALSIVALDEISICPPPAVSGLQRQPELTRSAIFAVAFIGRTNLTVRASARTPAHVNVETRLAGDRCGLIRGCLLQTAS